MPIERPDLHPDPGGNHSGQWELEQARLASLRSNWGAYISGSDSAIEDKVRELRSHGSQKEADQVRGAYVSMPKATGSFGIQGACLNGESWSLCLKPKFQGGNFNGVVLEWSQRF